MFSIGIINFDKKKYVKSLENFKKISIAELQNEKLYYISLNYFYLKQYDESILNLQRIKTESIDSDKYNILFLLNLYHLKRYFEISEYAEKLSDGENQNKLFYSAVAAFYTNDYKNISNI